jgi:enoyl-CoA hydratase
MAFESIRSEISDGVAIITLHCPETLNALSRQLVDELGLVLDSVDADHNARVIVVTGCPKAFAAGANVAEMQELSAQDVLRMDFSGCCERLATVSKPVIAAVTGYALGGGCELVEMSDIVIAADTAKFGHPEITLGTMSGAGGTQRLTRVVGKHKAMDLCLTGRFITAEEAERAGLVSRIVPEERVMDEAMDVARRIASFSAPVVLRIKEAVRYAASVGLAEGLRLERHYFHQTFATEDRAEGMRAFIEKRTPRFQDG